MWKLLGTNASDGVDEVSDGGAKVIIWGGGRDGDRIVGHPPNGLRNPLGPGGNVPNSVASIMTETGA